VALSAHHLNNAATLSATFGADLAHAEWQVARRDHAVAMILRYLGADVESPAREGSSRA
jgi:hypothetical protein